MAQTPPSDEASNNIGPYAAICTYEVLREQQSLTYCGGSLLALVNKF